MTVKLWSHYGPVHLSWKQQAATSRTLGNPRLLPPFEKGSDDDVTSGGEPGHLQTLQRPRVPAHHVRSHGKHLRECLEIRTPAPAQEHFPSQSRLSEQEIRNR